MERMRDVNTDSKEARGRPREKWSEAVENNLLEVAQERVAAEYLEPIRD